MRLYLAGLALFLICTKDLQAHPVHVTVLNIEYNQSAGKLEFTFRVYKDDMELALYHNYQLQTSLDSTSAGDKTISFLNRYMNEHFRIQLNGKEIDSIRFERTLFDGTNLWLYYGLPLTVKPENLKIKDEMMMDLYFDQTNLVICGPREDGKAYMLTYENTEFTHEF